MLPPSASPRRAAPRALLAFAGLCLACATTSAQDARIPPEELAKAPLRGSVRTEEVTSKALGRKLSSTIYLPPGYGEDPTRRYPLLVLLHDLFENHRRWIIQGGAQILDRAIVAGTLPPLIVVAPDGEDGLWVDAPGIHHAWRRYVLEDVLREAGEQFHVAAERTSRWIAGTGTGATAALAIALAQPELFGGVAAHAPPLLPEDPARLFADGGFAAHPVVRHAFAQAFGDPVDAAAWTAAYPLALARASDAAVAPAIVLESGTEDRFSAHEGVRALHEALEKRGVAHETLLRPGDRGWAPLQEYLPKSLAFLARSTKLWPPAAGTAAGDGEPKPPESGAKRDG